MSYPTLVRTLDVLRKEAPKSFKSYHPRSEDTEKHNQARATAFIHLLLKVQFGLVEFNSRHDHICDGSQDGGVDGYYIDSETRCITLIQSKFKTTKKKYKQKTIKKTNIHKK